MNTAAFITVIRFESGMICTETKTRREEEEEEFEHKLSRSHLKWMDFYVISIFEFY